MPNFDVAASLNRFAVACLPALLGIILHEVAHGWMAKRCGDPTAHALGRLTLNPIPHIDPMGLLVFALTSISSPFVFGWAKPVPVNTRYFRKPARDMMLVALAGPLTNMLLALMFAAALRIVLQIFPPSLWPEASGYQFVRRMLGAGVIINFSLAWLNLLPIPPLDGSRILAWFLPGDLGWRFQGFERYGFIILILLLATGVLGSILGPLVLGSAEFALRLVGLR
ncbi:MAG: site-2 protease family protein [Desulfovibrionaceae bacterium]|nr:site-2 protease family protein [Desulfovibrionaceae bacterium]